MDFTKFELEFIDSVRNGNSTKSPAASSPSKARIKASLLRKLILGLPISGVDEAGSRAPVPDRIVLRDCHIEGDELDLEFGRHIVGVEIPALHFSGVSCHRINLREADLRALEMEECQFELLDLEGARVSGGIRINRCQAIGSNNVCRIIGSGAEFKGTVEISKTTLRTLTRDPLPREGRPNYALQFNDARVDGELILFPDFSAHGGVSLRDTELASDLNLCGARLYRGENYALLMQSCIVGGSLLALPINSSDRSAQRFHAIGRVDMIGARFGGGIYMNSCLLEKPAMLNRVEAADGSYVALRIAECVMNASLHVHTQSHEQVFLQTRIEGILQLGNTKVGGDVNLTGTEIIGDVKHSIFGQRLNIGGSLQLDGTMSPSGNLFPFHAHKSVDFSGSTIAQHLSMNCTLIGDKEKASLDLARATLSGLFTNCAAGNDGKIVQSRITGGLYLSAATINGPALLQGILINGENGTALSASHANVRGEFFIGITSPNGKTMRSEFHGDLDFSGMQVGQNLRIAAAIIKGSQGSAIKGTGLQINGALTLHGAVIKDENQCLEITGAVDFSGIRVDKGVLFTGIRLSNPGGKALDMSDATIGGYMQFFQNSIPGQDNPVDISGQIDCSTMTVTRDFFFIGGSYKVDDVRQVAINLARTIVGGALSFTGRKPESGTKIEIKGVLDASAARIDAGFEVVQTHLSGVPALRASSLRATGDCWISPTTEGAINLFGLQVQGTLLMHDLEIIQDVPLSFDMAILDDPEKLAVLCEYLDWYRENDLEEDESKAISDFYFKRPRAIDRAEIERLDRQSRSGRITLSHANIERTLSVSDLKVTQTPDFKRYYKTIYGADADNYNTADFDLTQANCDALDDGGGRAWGDKITLSLQGFQYKRLYNYRSRRRSYVPYERIEGKEIRTRLKTRFREMSTRRNRWLRLQYANGKPTSTTFFNQPYEQLALTLRNQGDIRASRTVLAEKFHIETSLMTHPRKLLWMLHGLLFRYGLSPQRALATFAVFVLLGTLLTGIADNRGFLVANSKSTDASQSQQCGDRVIPWIYAMDTAVPILTFQQEQRCHLRSAHPEDAVLARVGSAENSWIGHTEIKESHLWRSGRGLYAIIGWVITSMMILTFAGVFRRAAEA